MTTEAQKRASKNYIERNYRINIVLPKDTPSRIEALGTGKSNSAWIRDIVLEKLAELENRGLKAQ